MLGFEHWYEVFVAELIRRSIRRDVMLVFLRSLAIHISWIPFIGERRDGVEPPMNEDAELRIFVPSWRLVFLQRFPVRTERPLPIKAIYFLENGVSLSVKFFAGFFQT